MDSIVRNFRCPKCGSLLQFETSDMSYPNVKCGSCGLSINKGVVEALTRAYYTYNDLNIGVDNETLEIQTANMKSDNSGCFASFLIVGFLFVLGVIFINWIGNMGGKWTLYVCDETMIGISGNQRCRSTYLIVPEIGNKDYCFSVGNLYLNKDEVKGFDCGRKCDGTNVCKEICNNKGECTD